MSPFPCCIDKSGVQAVHLRYASGFHPFESIHNKAVILDSDRWHTSSRSCYLLG